MPLLMLCMPARKSVATSGIDGKAQGWNYWAASWLGTQSKGTGLVRGHCM